MQNGRPKYLFVINSGSGKTDNLEKEEKIKNFLSGTDLSKSIFNLPAKFDLKQIKDHVLKINPEKLVAVGGDGTVTMLATIASCTDLSLGIIPGGSANGMAKELGIPEDTDAALQILEEGIEKKCDLIKINEKDICLHLSDIGLNAQLIKHFDEGELRGKIGYARVIFKTLLRKQKLYVQINTEKEQVKRVAFMIALANASTYGTGAVINPEGKLDDGLFEVIIVKALSVAALLKMLFRPGIFNPKHIEIICAKSVSISTTRNVHFQVDGEYKGKIKNIDAEIMPGAITLILPGGL